MNTTTTITSTSRLALGTAVAALCLGAAACGAETAVDPAASIKQAGSQQQSRISPRAAEHQAELEAQAQRQRAEHADAKRWTRGHETTDTRTATTHGSRKFPDLLPEAGSSNAQRTEAQYGSQKFPDLRP